MTLPIDGSKNYELDIKGFGLGGIEIWDWSKHLVSSENRDQWSDMKNEDDNNESLECVAHGEE